MKTTIVAACAALLALSAPSPATETPYAGQQQRAIKALAEDEVSALMAGAGMGYAKAAELNSHPGPMHALELADRLELTAEQRRSLADLMARHKAEARRLGAEVVRLEGELDRMFASRAADAAGVERKTAEIGAMQARLRASHLVTHIATTSLLTPRQVARYDELRGYRGEGSGAGSGAAGAPQKSPAKSGHHRHH